MEHAIQQTEEGLRITASVSGDKQGELLRELGKCASGQCSCPSTQFDKLEAIEVTPTEAGVAVELKARSGETLDAADIERCLEHTARQIGS